jgi:hypothetical protein
MFKLPILISKTNIYAVLIELEDIKKTPKQRTLTKTFSLAHGSTGPYPNHAQI